MNILSPIIRHGLPSAAVALHLFVAACASAAELPSVQELIRETSETCEKVRAESDEIPNWGWMMLAEAQAWSGDYEKSLETASQMTVSGFRQITKEVCWQIQVERSGVIAPLPIEAPGETATGGNISESTKLIAAQTLAKAGRLDEAKTFLPKDKRDRESAWALSTFYMSLAEDQFARGDRKGTSESLQHAWRVSAHFNGDVYFHVGWIHTMVELWVKLGDRASAIMGKDAALKYLQQRTGQERPSKTLSLAWARQGKLHALFGEIELARDAFAKAVQTADGADQIDAAADSYDGDFRAGEHGETLGRIGAWQFSAGMKDEARESYRQALARLDEIKDEQKRDYNVLKILDRQREVGDIDEALKSIDQIKGAYFSVSCYCHCAEILSAKDRKMEARELLHKAEGLADGKREPNQTPHMLVKIAETYAKVANVESARPYYRKAIDISLTSANHDWHQAIARSQLRLGLIEDAYDTTLAIPNLYYRSLPLAELTEAVAKKEALSRKKEIKK